MTAKPKPATAPSVFTANRLRDGRVVWLAAGGAWSTDVAAAEAFPPDRLAVGEALAQRAEAAQQVVGAYAVAVSLSAAGPVPVKFRERLRASGPSIAAEPAEWRGDAPAGIRSAA